eukprot:s438_g11.t2
MWRRRELSGAMLAAANRGYLALPALVEEGKAPSSWLLSRPLRAAAVKLLPGPGPVVERLRKSCGFKVEEAALETCALEPPFNWPYGLEGASLEARRQFFREAVDWPRLEEDCGEAPPRTVLPLACLRFLVLSNADQTPPPLDIPWPYLGMLLLQLTLAPKMQQEMVADLRVQSTKAYCPAAVSFLNTYLGALWSVSLLNEALGRPYENLDVIAAYNGPFLHAMIRCLHTGSSDHRFFSTDDEERVVLRLSDGPQEDLIGRLLPIFSLGVVEEVVKKALSGKVSNRREGIDESLEGFIWRPGMEKCTEGIWIWSEVFVCKADDEDVAVLLMDTQGAWDAKMSKEQSATVFGLTTLLASRLVYNVSKQIQQDKIENLLYFTDFARAALRAQKLSAQPDGKDQPFQTLEFLVRDWPHFQENCSLSDARSMMKSHLDQYFDPKKSEDTKSVKALGSLFQDIDVWCLPHPSLKIERDSWNGDLVVIEKEFWRFIDGYMERIFSPAQLQAKENLGNFITVDSFGTVLREFIAAFSDAAPQAKTFSEAMEASTSLLARDVAMKKVKQILAEKAGSLPQAVSEEAESNWVLGTNILEG